MINLLAFMEKCARHRCVVIPIEVYSGYNNDKVDKSTFVGVFYAVMESGYVVSSDHWSMYIDDSVYSESEYHKTPEEALEWYIKDNSME